MYDQAISPFTYLFAFIGAFAVVAICRLIAAAKDYATQPLWMRKFRRRYTRRQSTLTHAALRR